MHRFIFACATLTLCALAAAQEFPSRPVRIIVPYAAGGLPDVAMRALCQPLAAELGRPCTVENLPGSNAVVAVNALLAAPADGHTLLCLDAAQWAIIPAMTPRLPYEPVRDFAPVGLFGQNTGFLLVVGTTVPARTLQDLVAYARAHPGELSYGSAGHGTAHHLVMEDVKARLSLDILHVPYKGTAQALPAVIGGQVSMTVSANHGVAMTFAKEGKLAALGVSTLKRSPLAPDVPPMADAGMPGFEHRTALGLVARAGTPSGAIDRLSAALRRALDAPETIARFEANGLEPAADASPATLAARIRDDRVLYGRIVKQLPIATE